MRVIEQSSIGRVEGQNLDRVVVTDDYAAVFDGTTVKSADPDEGLRATNALVDDLVATVTGLAPALAVPGLLAALTATAAEHRRLFVPSAAAAIYSAHLGQVVVVGDAWVAVDDDVRFFGHRIEGVLAQLRAAFTELELAKGATVDRLRADDPGRDAILPLLARERELRNVDADGSWFFAGFDGSPVPLRLVRVVDVPPTTDQLVIASDGYPRLGGDLAACETALADVVSRDPLMTVVAPGTKAVHPGAVAYDDRTYLRLEV